MCLDVTDKTRYTATEDIVVYKEVYTIKTLLNTFRTIYQHSTVVLGETYTSNLILVKDYDERYYDLEYVEIGLHSYKDMPRRSTYYKLIKCIIPKGAEYYVGKFDGDDSYASTELKYLEVID